MAATATQQTRLLKLESPLGPDTLLMAGFSATERISELFHFDLDLLVEPENESKVKPDQLLGKQVTASVALAADYESGPRRFFNGIVTRFSETGRDDRFVSFSLELASWAWLLTQKSNCRIFQDKTAPEIIKKVFDELRGDFPELVNYRDALEKTYTKQDYCVQYRESDFHFVSRLMEEEGISYFFEHKEGKHTLVLADAPSAYSALPKQSKVRCEPETGFGEREAVVTSIRAETVLRSGKLTTRDHHFQMPPQTLESTKTAVKPIGGNDKLELYDYPGAYAQRFDKPDERLGEVEKEGGKLNGVQIEAIEALQKQVSGSSTCAEFTPGFKFELSESPGGSADGGYLLTAVQHSAEQSSDYSSGGGGGGYRNSFSCIPDSVTYRPSRSVPKPAVEGLQSAVVVGPSGEEIHTDKYGRVKVQFHWDREGKKNENSSCWVRVGQAAAGTQWGSFFWPRIGHEVLVAFLEGDPDQPIIVGSVYNYDNMPPYELPGNKTRSGIKTRSTLKGNDKTFNEIRFEDKKDKEEIYLHAEKDLNTVIENNETRKIGFDKKDKGDQTIEVYNNRTIKVGKAGCADGSQDLTVYKDRTAKIEMGNDSLTIKMGNQTTKLDLGKSETEAMQSIELKVGQSSIKVDQTGITMEGMMLKLNGTVMTQVKGLMTQVNADAILTVKGSLTMIN